MKNLLIVTLLLYGSTMLSQSIKSIDCTRIISDVRTHLKQNELDSAQARLRLLEDCDANDEYKNIRVSLQDSINLLHKQQRGLLLAAIQQAVANAKEAERQRDIATAEKEKVQKNARVSEIAAHALKQFRHNNTHAMLLANLACQQSEFTNPIATETRGMVFSQYDNLFYNKSYFYPLQKKVTQLAVSSRDRFIVAGFEDGNFRVWDNKTGLLLHYSTDISKREFVFMEQLIMKKELFRPANTEEFSGYFADFDNNVKGIAISDEGVLAIAQNDTILIYPSGQTANPSVVVDQTRSIQTLGISPDGQYLLVTSNSVNNILPRLIKLKDVFSITDHTLDLNSQGILLANHEHVTVSVAFSDYYIATASADKTVNIYNKTGDFLRKLSGHAGSLINVDIHSRLPYVVTCAEDKSIRLFNIENGRELARWPLADNALTVRFIDSINYVIATLANGEVNVYDFSGQVVFRLNGHYPIVSAMAAANRSAAAYTGDETGVIRRWTIKSRTPLNDKTHLKGIEDACFMGNDILTASLDNNIKLWNAAGECLVTFKGHSGAVRTIDVLPGSGKIVSGGRDNEAYLWNKDGVVQGVLRGHSGTVYKAFFIQNGKQIVTGSSDGTIRFWSTSDLIENRKIMVGYRINAMAVSENGAMIAVGSNASEMVYLLSSKNNAPMRKDSIQYHFEQQAFGVSDLELSPDHESLLICGASYVMLYNLKNKTSRYFQFNESIIDGKFSKDGKFIALVGNEGNIYYGRLDQFETNKTITTQRRVKGVNFSPDGKQLLVYGYDGNARILDVGTQATRMILGAPTDDITALVLAGSKIIATDGEEITVWDENGQFNRIWSTIDQIHSLTYNAVKKEIRVMSDSILSIIGLDQKTERHLTFPFEYNQVQLSPQGTLVSVNTDTQNFVYNPENGDTVVLGGNAAYKYNWINNRFLYQFDQQKKAIRIFDNKNYKRVETYSIREINTVIPGVSLDNNYIVMAESINGWLFLFNRNSQQVVDSINTRHPVQSITFIDDKHFLLYNGANQTVYLHGITKDRSGKIQITPVLQSIADCSDAFDYNPISQLLVLARGSHFYAYPLAVMDRNFNSGEIESIRPQEMIRFDLNPDEFKLLNAHKNDPVVMTDLAMYQYEASRRERYYDKSVRLIAAQRYANASQEKELTRFLEKSLLDIESDMVNASYDRYTSEQEVKNWYYNDYLQYIKDADSLYNKYYKQDPDPLYKNEAADRYSSAAYQAILIGKPKEALKLAQNALNICPQKTWANTNLALAYLYSGDPDKAKKVYDRYAGRLWAESGYPRSTPELVYFCDAFLADIEDLDSHIEAYPGLFGHLKRQHHNQVKTWLSCKQLTAKEGPKPVFVSPAKLKTDCHGEENKLFAVIAGSFDVKEVAVDSLALIHSWGFKNAYLDTSARKGKYVLVVEKNLKCSQVAPIQQKLIEKGHSDIWYLYKRRSR